MTAWFSALKALRPRALVAQRKRLDDLARTTKALRAEARDAQRLAEHLSARVDRAEAQIGQVTALATSEVLDGQVLDELVRCLDPQALRARAREAVDQAEIIDHPVPHTVVTTLLSADVYRAAVANVPRDVFFEAGEASIAEVRVPPLGASTRSLVVWDALADLVKGEVGPRLLRRFASHLDAYLHRVCPSADVAPGPKVTWRVEPGRLLLDRDRAVDARWRPWRIVTAYVPLGDAGTSSAYTAHVAVRQEDGSVSEFNVRCPAASAIVVLGAHVSCHWRTDGTGGTTSVPTHTWECGVVVPRQSRAPMLESMPPHVRANWVVAGGGEGTDA